MFAIAKTFTFSAAHVLAWISDEHHPCARVHGHNYRVTLTFEADLLDGLGFVIDTHELRFFREYLDRWCEHTNLNESLPSLEGETTGERLAVHFADYVRDHFAMHTMETPRLASVRVCETDTVCAEWRP